MNRPEKRKLERVKYWQGQMLRARDFRDLEAMDAQRRWWHNRALHNAYGVSEGLNCSLVPANPPFTAVSVSPGVAYDIFGRELILERSQSIPLPSNLPKGLIGSVSLLLRYKGPSGTMPPDESSEVCWIQPGPIRPGTIEFAWKLTSNLKPIDGLPVFGVYYTVAPPPIRPDPYFVRISTRPLAGPLLATGTTVPGNTPWEELNSGGLDDNGVPIPIGVQTMIDTSGAGFTQIPCYFAWLEGSVWNPQTQQLAPALFPSIADESTTGFSFVLSFRAVSALLPDTKQLRFIQDLDTFSLFAQQQKLYVAWIGCQMQTPIPCCST